MDSTLSLDMNDELLAMNGSSELSVKEDSAASALPKLSWVAPYKVGDSHSTDGIRPLCYLGTAVAMIECSGT